MTLGQLVEALGPPAGHAGPPLARAADTAATGVVYDSRRAAPGAVFVALRGQKADGAAFAAQAIARGAAVVVAETRPASDPGVPWIVVEDARLALAKLAVAFSGDPSASLAVVGVTGTNGKTTTAYLLRAIFEAAGMKCGLLGTVVYDVGTGDQEAVRTTPEAPDLQAMLRAMVDNGCRAAAMEVSSHALALRRADGIRFAAAVFTNLTRDHLDFHGDMESYFAAKRRLFEMLPADAPAIVNIDDPAGGRLVPTVRRPVTFGIRQRADVMPQPFQLSLTGLRFTADTPRGPVAVRSPLVGQPNVYNLLGAVATGVALDLPIDAIEAGLARLRGVPGRFEVASGPDDDVSVVVDYAHTDDALKNLLETARALSGGRLITVFGCGGDRDRTKRPLMGAVAGRMSDIVIVTSDNPRSEDPERIVEDVLRGIPGADRPAGRQPKTQPAQGPQVHAIVDRAAAIGRAVDEARPGDLVIVAGKGHEKTQVIGDRALPFDDVAVAREALRRRRARLSVQ